MNKAEFTEQLSDAIEQSLSEVESVEPNRMGVMVELLDGEQWLVTVKKIRDGLGSDDEADESDDDDDDDDEEEDDDG